VSSPTQLNEGLLGELGWGVATALGLYAELGFGASTSRCTVWRLYRSNVTYLELLSGKAAVDVLTRGAG
jgi:hypothetical protein